MAEFMQYNRHQIILSRWYCTRECIIPIECTAEICVDVKFTIAIKFYSRHFFREGGRVPRINALCSIEISMNRTPDRGTKYSLSERLPRCINPDRNI